MNEDFVSFSLAEKLKEKGYCNYASYWDYTPTISQVLKWLREEEGISLNVYPSYFANLLYWTCDVISFIGEISIEKRLGGDVKTYEEAAIAGIEYVLDNLI